MGTVVTFQDVVERFSRSRRAQTMLAAWRQDVRRVEVAPAVMAHRADVVQQPSSTDVEDLCRRTEHALGEVRRRDVASIESIRDWTTPFATMHVLHFVTEHSGQLPTWEEFRSAVEEPPFRSMSRDPADVAVQQAIAEGHPPAAVRGAMRWRIGNFYYSFLREQYVQAVLRDEGHDVRQHPLADVLFRVDFWIGDTNFDLFIGNHFFRDGAEGRKLSSQVILADAVPPFRVRTMQLPTEHVFGRVHLPSREVIIRAAEELMAEPPDLEQPPTGTTSGEEPESPEDEGPAEDER